MRRTLWTSLLAALTACGLPDLKPVELARVTDAPAATGARALTLTATSVPARLGTGRYDRPRHPRGGSADPPPQAELWVVPLVDPGQTLGDTVSAWVAPPEAVDAGAGAEAWLAELARGLDGQRLTLKIAVRQGDRNFSESAWGRAVADAEARHGLRSAERAPVLFFPAAP